MEKISIETEKENLIGTMECILKEWYENGKACTRFEFENIYRDIRELLK